MKRAKTMAIILAMTLILPGCEEVENPEALNEITTLLENIDLSAVSAPEEVSVYSAVLWGQPPEKAAGIFDLYSAAIGYTVGYCESLSYDCRWDLSVE